MQHNPERVRSQQFGGAAHAFGPGSSASSSILLSSEKKELLQGKKYSLPTSHCGAALRRNRTTHVFRATTRRIFSADQALTICARKWNGTCRYLMSPGRPPRRCRICHGPLNCVFHRACWLSRAGTGPISRDRSRQAWKGRAWEGSVTVECRVMEAAKTWPGNQNPILRHKNPQAKEFPRLLDCIPPRIIWLNRKETSPGRICQRDAPHPPGI